MMLKQFQVALILSILNIGYGQELSLHLSPTVFSPAGIQFKQVYGASLAFSGGIELSISQP
jgi:hypothetical protein